MFGASADNGYASFLSSFSIDTDISARIRILKGPPFSFEFKKIISRFKWTEFTNVFRSDFISRDPPWRKSQEIGQQRVKEALSSTTKNNSSQPWRPREISWSATKVSTNTNSAQVSNGSNGLPEDDAAHEDTIKSALVRVTNQCLKETPNQINFAIVKHRVENICGLSSDFWGREEKDGWFLKSKNISKKTVEDWVQKTGNPPPGNATWMINRFNHTSNHRSSTTKDTSSASSWAGQVSTVHTQGETGTTNDSCTPVMNDERDSSEDFDDMQCPIFRDIKGSVADDPKPAGDFEQAEPSSQAECYAEATNNRVALDEHDESKQTLVYQNSQHQRFDLPIDPHYDRETLNRLRARPKRLCNGFYLGKCYNSDRCFFDHESVLSQNDLVALQFLARCNPCAKGSACELGECIYGHICPHQDNCDMARCKFKGMHNIDTEVANVIEVA